MKKVKIAFWILMAFVLYATAHAEETREEGLDSNAGFFADKTISSEEFSRAYFIIYNDVLSNGGRFTEEELSDIVETYKSSQDEKGLSSKLSAKGSSSNKVIGSILERAGANFELMSTTATGGAKAIYWCQDAVDVYEQACCIDKNSEPGYCWSGMICDQESQVCIYGSSEPVCGDGACEAGETSQNCPADCGTASCSDHDECSQACTSKCPYGVFGCCNGCQIGQCVNGQCTCQESQNYCGNNPTYQVGTECNGGTDKWCYDAVTADGWGCCVDQDSDPWYCWEDEECDEQTQECVDRSSSTVCGNGVCETGETIGNCPADCSTTTASCQELCRKKNDLNGKPFNIFSCVKTGSVCLFVPEPRGDSDCANIAQDAGAKCCCSNCGDLDCGAGENDQNCLADCGTNTSCSDHDECSQACTSKCPYGVFGCCNGCQIGQCVNGQCTCQESQNYCGNNPTYQVGTECNGGTDDWCYNAVTEDGDLCCVDQNIYPGYCWGDQECDEQTQKCVDASGGTVCGNGICESGETSQNCPADCGTASCSDHDECSQACTSKCPYGVFGCCNGCQIGQCVNGQCTCQESQNYCGNNPTYQVGTECNGGTDKWCYDAVTADGWGCCVDQNSDPGYCWTNEYCDPETNTCV